MEWSFESADQIYPSTLRQEFMALLHDEGTPSSDFAAAELIYGELISNAIRHAGGRVTVSLEWGPEYPVLRVHDKQRVRNRRIALPADPFAESGRGLYIVKSLAKDFHLSDDGGAGCIANATLPVRRISSAERESAR